MFHAANDVNTALLLTRFSIFAIVLVLFSLRSHAADETGEWNRIIEAGKLEGRI